MRRNKDLLRGVVNILLISAVSTAIFFGLGLFHALQPEPSPFLTALYFALSALSLLFLMLLAVCMLADAIDQSR